MKLKHRCRHPLIEVERILQGISWDSGNAGEESPITGGDVADGVNSTLVAAGVDVVELSLPTWEHLWHRVDGPHSSASLGRSPSECIHQLKLRLRRTSQFISASAESRDEILSPPTLTSPGAQMWFHQRQFADTWSSCSYVLVTRKKPSNVNTTQFLFFSERLRASQRLQLSASLFLQ